MVARDIPEILSWAKDREALETFVSDAKVGRAAV